MRQYRRKNRARLNAYQRRYYSSPARKEKHKQVCDDWRKNRMTEETKQKIKEYQKEYYEQRKNTTQVDF